MNDTTVTTEKLLQPCETYEWCGGHEEAQLPVADPEAQFHYDKDERDFQFAMGCGDRIGSRPIIHFVHESDHTGHLLYVQFDDATIDVPRDEVPQYLEELRRFVDELETYYRLHVAYLPAVKA
jgi:hypothetical protein